MKKCHRVILSEAKDLLLTNNNRSFASLRMTNSSGLVRDQQQMLVSERSFRCQ